MRKKLKVGFDFDGVVAYNPFRVIRAPWALFKRRVLGIKKLTFFYPKSSWQKIFWIIIHESSIFPANGTKLLRELVKRGDIEAHLVTARYSFLDDHLYGWLDKFHLRDLFKTIHLNKNDEQPHVFKERVVKELQFDVFIEDNLDIVEYLQRRSDTKIFWIYNITDRFHPYPFKYPYLKKALGAITFLLQKK